MIPESVASFRSDPGDSLGSRVLITGAGGFIGSHLTELCVARGYQVRALVHYNANSRWGWLDHSPVRDQVEVVAAAVRDFDCVYRATADCDAVFHLAALIAIPYSYRTPLGYVRTTIAGTYNVLEAARLHHTRRVATLPYSAAYLAYNALRPSQDISPILAIRRHCAQTRLPDCPGSPDDSLR